MTLYRSRSRRVARISSSMPELSLVSSQLQLIKLEKEGLLSELKEANSEISLLKSRCKTLEKADIKNRGTKFLYCVCPVTPDTHYRYHEGSRVNHTRPTAEYVEPEGHTYSRVV